MSRALRAQALQGRILSSPPALPVLPTDLHYEIAQHLASACDDGWILGGSELVWQLVKLSTRPDPDDRSLVRFVINLGSKDQRRNTKRSKDLPHFIPSYSRPELTDVCRCALR